jgi:hypothetical protein
MKKPAEAGESLSPGTPTLHPMPIVSTYLLPPPSWKTKGKPYPSHWKMTAEEAKARGAISIVPGTTEERQEVKHQAAGLDGVRG